MILELFVVLIAIFLIMIYLGYHAETPLYSMIGYFFIFLLSFTLIGNNIEYRTGQTDTTNNAINVTTTVYSYTKYADSKTYGYYLAVSSAVMFVLTLIQTTAIGDRLNERFFEQ